MEHEDSLPHSQVPTTCPYTEPDQSSRCPPSHFLNILILSSHLLLGLPSGLFPLGFPTKTLYIPLPFPHTCNKRAYLILLDFITRTTFGEQYRSLNSSLCSFLHSLLTSSPLGPNILLSTLFSNTASLRSSHNVSDQSATDTE